jgi:hypothetical protein
MKKVTRKSLIIRESGRSTDFITPSFGYGCKLFEVYWLHTSINLAILR